MKCGGKPGGGNDAHRPATAIYSKNLFPKGAFLAACTLPLQAHSWIRKDAFAAHHAVVGSLRQLFSGLFGYHVRGVPVGPIRVALPGALFMLAVRGFRKPKRARQIVRRCECRRRGVDAPRQPRRQLLEQPAVAVRITERGE